MRHTLVPQWFHSSLVRSKTTHVLVGLGLLLLVASVAWLTGCGGGGGNTTNTNSNNNNNNNNSNNNTGYAFGQRQGVMVYMNPAPSSYSFTPWQGANPAIRIDQVTQFASTVNPTGTNIYQQTTQVVYGQVTGPTSGFAVVVYSFTNTYYIQPLTSTTINIASDSTWIAPANAGQVVALLVRQGYAAPDTTSTLPAIDGVNVLAMATQTVNTSSSSFSEYAIPTNNSGPFSITTGPDSALWFSENYAGRIGRITTSGMIGEYAITTANSGPDGIVSGSDGALWFVESNANQIGRITTSGQVTEFRIPTAGSTPKKIATGPDGALWFTESQASQIGRITSSGVVTEYIVPTSGSAPWGIVAGPDGTLWFTESTGNKIGSITTSGQITEYPIPNTLGFVPSPVDIIVGADGALWFTGSPAGLGRITTSGTMTLWNISWNNIAVGPDQMMWFAGYNGSVGSVGQFKETQQLSSFDVPQPAAPGIPGQIITGPDAALWFVDSSNYIVRYGPN